MGGDGQALVNNRKLLEGLYKKQGQDATNMKFVDRQNRLQYCAASHVPLQPPVCIDLGGRLYNRDAVVNLLLERKALGAAAMATHVSSPKRLKDVRDVEGVVVSDAGTVELVCSETGKQSGGSRALFACNWLCGHVVAVGEEEHLDGKPCPSCGLHGEDGTVQLWVRLGLDDEAAAAQWTSLQTIIRKRTRDA